MPKLKLTTELIAVAGCISNVSWRVAQILEEFELVNGMAGFEIAVVGEEGGVGSDLVRMHFGPSSVV